jgi:glycosyltransferase involved in cell wall biosynthesis
MTREPRLLFVLAEQLGWRTYAKLFRNVLSARDDIVWEVLNPGANRLYGALLKRHNLRGYGRWFRRLDPISAYGSYLGQSVRDAVDRFKPDVVHFAGHLPAGSLSRLRDGPPFTVALDATRCNIDTLRRQRVWTDQEYNREARLLREAALLFPMSSWAGRSLREDYGVPDTRVVVVPPSVDPEIFGARRPITQDGDLVRIIFIGNDFRRKGGHLLLDWMKGPLAGSCELHIVSSDPALAGLAKPGVVVHGGVPHAVLMREILPQMDILCHPTQSDMSAYVVVEAALAGIPSVASRIGGIPELILEGRTGWCIDPSDEDGFVKKLRELASDRTLISAAGKQANEHARKNFDARSNCSRVIERLKELAGAG